MSKTSFIFGLTVSLLVHLTLFLPGSASDPQVNEVQPVHAGKILVPLRNHVAEEPPPPAALPPAPLPQEPIMSASAQPPTAEPMPPFTQVVTASAKTDHQRHGETASNEPNPDTFPRLGIVWDNVWQLRDVAQAMGMRIVVADASNKVLGEVSLAGGMDIVAFRGDFSHYSNRIRSMPLSFFGNNLLNASTHSIAAVWLLVPSDLDQQFLAIQRRLLQERGLEAKAVRAMEGRFVRNDRGEHQLSITQVIQ